MELIKIQPDRERAKSLMELSLLRLKKIRTFNKKTESPLIVEGYYEVAKELITAILFVDGFKTLSHKDLIEYIRTNHNLSGTEINLLNELRKYRNKIVYYGINIQPEYLQRNSTDVNQIISKLTKICERKLE